MKMSSTQVYVRFNEDTNFYFGLILAISASLFIGTSFIIKKKALLRLGRKGCLRAGNGGFGYLKEWLWWCGFLCMGIGEGTNFAAYAFAPASLVTPLGALSVLVSAILSSIFLKENLNLLGKLGCVLCLLGSTIIVIHSPNIQKEETYSTIIEKLSATTFILYVCAIIILTLIIMFHFGPKYGNQSLIWYMLLCSGIGSLTVMSCKCLGVVIRASFNDRNGDNFSYFLPVGLILSVIFCICIQMTYLNRALDLFNTCIVTPVYYVFFTSFVLTASGILFKEWGSLHAIDILGSICGFSVVIIAVILLNAFKNMDISMRDIKGIMRPVNIMTDINNISRSSVRNENTHL